MSKLNNLFIFHMIFLFMKFRLAAIFNMAFSILVEKIKDDIELLINLMNDLLHLYIYQRNELFISKESLCKILYYYAVCIYF